MPPRLHGTPPSPPLLAAVAALLLTLTAVRGIGQGEALDENTLALLWSRGDFRAPLVCTIAGESHRGFRRVLVEAGPPQVSPEVNRIRFYDLEVPAGTPCVTETRGPSPNVLGAVSILRRGRSRPDTGRRDFTATLRRDGGFGFEIVGGRLRVGPTEDPAEMKLVEFRGGQARFEEIRRGSDAWRRLADLPATRRLRLTLEAPDGTRLTFDLVQLGGP